jgi:uncharacterized membrane protein
MRRLLACLVVLCAIAGLARADNKAPASFTTIDAPGSVSTFPFGINHQGDIIGSYTASDGVDHGFLLQKGAFTTIDFPGADGSTDPILGLRGSYPRNTSPQGDLVGFYVAGSVTHGFLLQKGAFTTIDFPGATATRVFGIDPETGGIVGFYIASGVTHGFLLQKGAFTTIDPPGSTFTEMTGINREDDTVGLYTDVVGVTHGFLLQKGAFTTIDFPGSTFTFATGINPEGKNKREEQPDGKNKKEEQPEGENKKIIIVGFYVDTSGFGHGFVASVAK